MVEKDIHSNSLALEAVMGNCDQILLHEESDSATFKFVKPIITNEIEQWIRSFKETWVFGEDYAFAIKTGRAFIR